MSKNELKTVVDRETAEKDVNAWLDAKRIIRSKRENYQAIVEQLIDATMDGCLIFTKSGVTQRLLIPVTNAEGKETVKELTYKLRLRVDESAKAKKGFENDDGTGQIIGIVAELTGQPRNIIRHLYDSDWSIVNSIAVFFV